MAGPDLSLITNAPNLTDTISQHQAIASQLQAQQIEIKTKQNLYAMQVMSAAASSGDPQRIQMAKQALSQVNIDPSSWSDDPTMVATQAAALQKALIPPVAMMNAGIQQQKANAMTATNNGTLAPDNTGVGSPTPSAAPSLNSPVPSSGGQATPSTPAIAGALNSTPNAAIPAQPASPSTTPPSLTAPIPSSAPAIPQQPTQDDPKYNGLNPKTRKESFEADLAAYNNIPAVITAKKQAETIGSKTGDVTVDDQENAIKSNQATGIVQQNINGIIELAKRGNLPEGATSSLSSGAYNLFAPGSDTAQDSKSFNTLNEAQTIGAIRDLGETGQIKMSRTLENIINRGYLVDPTASNDEKIVQANMILNELKNSAIASSNISAQRTGGQQTPFVPMTVAPNAPQDDPITAELKRRGALK